MSERLSVLTPIVGNGQHRTGITDKIYRPVARAGLPIYAKSQNNVGIVRFDVIETAREYGVPAHPVLRFVNAAGTADVPRYDLPPLEAAVAYADVFVPYVLDRTAELRGEEAAMTWLEILNEPRAKYDTDNPNWNNMHPVSWLAEFFLHLLPILLDRLPFKLLTFSWNAGEPALDDWLLPEMAELIAFIIANKDRVGMAFHEGFGDRDWRNLSAGDITPHLTGRFLYPIELYGEFPVAITEFAFAYNNIPERAKVLSDFDWLLRNVYNHPAVRAGGGVCWYTADHGDQWGGLPEAVNGYFDDIASFALDNEYTAWTGNGYWPPDDLPDAPDPEPEPIPPTRVTYLLIPPLRALDTGEIVDVINWAENGLTLPDGTRTAGEHPVSPSHIDAIQSVLWGTEASRLIILWGDRIGTGLTREWMQENFPAVVPRTIWINPGAHPLEGLRLGVPLTGPYRITSKTDEPRDYDGDGIYDDKHEGWDFANDDPRSRVIAVLEGVVDGKGYKPDGYGHWVRMRHEYNGEVLQTWHGHMAEASPVAIGAQVRKGGELGIPGRTGHASGVHDHLTLVWVGKGLKGYAIDDIIDPGPYLDLTEVPIEDEPSTGPVPGVDVSHWQGTMDWAKTREQGARFAFVKVTEGTTVVDARAAANVAGARAQGMLAGPYHYYRNWVDPIAQADHFVKYIPIGCNLPPVVDFEDPNGAPSDIGHRLMLFMQRVQGWTGVWPQIAYTRANYWNQYLRDAVWAAEHHLFVAHYTDRESPSIPVPWNRWTFWQYTSQGDGRRYGASSDVIDLDIFNGDMAALQQLVVEYDRVEDPPPPPPPPPPAGGPPPPWGEMVRGLDQPASDWAWPSARGVFEITGLKPKFHTSGISHTWYQQYKHPNFNPVRVVIDRGFTNRDPGAIWNEMRGEIAKFWNLGERNFIFLNEPNITHEHLGKLWNNGTEFGRTFREICRLARAEYGAGLRIWFPGTSPGFGAEHAFIDAAKAEGALDFVFGLVKHVYTGITNDEVAATNQVVTEVIDYQRRHAAQRPIIIGETSVNRPASADYKARVAVRVFNGLANVQGIWGVYVFTSDWSGSTDPNQEGWLRNGIHLAYGRVQAAVT